MLHIDDIANACSSVGIVICVRLRPKLSQMIVISFYFNQTTIKLDSNFAIEAVESTADKQKQKKE